MKSLESTSLASQLNRVNMLIPTVISRSWVSLGVLVGHGRSQSIEDGAGGNIFGSDEDDRFALTLNLQFLEFLSEHGWMKTRLQSLTIISAISGSVSTKDFSNSCMMSQQRNSSGGALKAHILVTLCESIGVLNTIGCHDRGIEMQLSVG
jgi:hypothetical protein